MHKFLLVQSCQFCFNKITVTFSIIRFRSETRFIVLIKCSDGWHLNSTTTTQRGCSFIGMALCLISSITLCPLVLERLLRRLWLHQALHTLVLHIWTHWNLFPLLLIWEGREDSNYVLSIIAQLFIRYFSVSCCSFTFLFLVGTTWRWWELIRDILLLRLWNLFRIILVLTSCKMHIFEANLPIVIGSPINRDFVMINILDMIDIINGHLGIWRWLRASGLLFLLRFYMSWIIFWNHEVLFFYHFYLFCSFISYPFWILT